MCISHIIWFFGLSRPVRLLLPQPAQPSQPAPLLFPAACRAAKVVVVVVAQPPLRTSHLRRQKGGRQLLRSGSPSRPSDRWTDRQTSFGLFFRLSRG
ncbi:hypothetical protein DFJ73DRAFT_875287, partial [Zopfochytrium polystomum]